MVVYLPATNETRYLQIQDEDNYTEEMNHTREPASFWRENAKTVVSGFSENVGSRGNKLSCVKKESIRKLSNCNFQ